MRGRRGRGFGCRLLARRTAAVGGAGALVIALTLSAGASGSGGGPASDQEWLAYGADPQLTAFSPAAAFTSTVSGFEPEWQASLDGAVVASPVAAVLPGQGLVVFAATEAGNVYAIGAGGGVLWKASLGSVTADDDCGSYGVSSTPVLDLARGLLYVADADGFVHGLRLTDGSEAPGWPVGVVQRPHSEYVWGGLRLLGNRLYVPFASYCDGPGKHGDPTEGGLLALDVDDPSSAPDAFDPVPGPDNGGGVWGWGGISVSTDGSSIYLGVANAEPDTDSGYSDSMVELSPDLSQVIGWDRPPGAAAGGDTDLGAAPVLFQPDGCPPLLAANDKDGDLLVWRQNALGAGPVDRIPLSDGIAAFVGAPSWSPRTQMLYDAGATMENSQGQRVAGTIALEVTASCGFAARWFRATGDGNQPQPLVAGDLVVSTGGTSGGITVQRAATSVLVWQYQTAGDTLSPPIVADGLLIVGDGNGDLYAFRPTQAPPPAGAAAVDRAPVLRVSTFAWPKPAGRVVAAVKPTAGVSILLGSIENLIPMRLPKNPPQSCRSGVTVQLTLRGGRVVTYGPCKLPPSIERLRLALENPSRKDT
jgi:hypothetical protein